MAQITDSWWNTDYNTTEGNEFYVATMKNAGANDGSEDLRLYLYATARKETYIKISNRNLSPSSEGSYNEIIKIPTGGQNGILIPLNYLYSDLSGELEDENNSIEKIYRITNPQEKALHVITCDASGREDRTKPKVSLYLTSFYNKEGFEATNILPVEALEREYMVQTYHSDMAATEFLLVATENAQEFEINMQISRHANNNNIIEKDTTIRVKCNKGQTRLIGALDQRYSLSGTTVCSNQRFVLINGNQDARIPDQNKRLTNHIFEQNPTSDKWGRKYVVTPTAGHKEGTDYVLLTAISDDTQIKKNGILLTTLQKGQTYTDILKYNTSTNSYDVPYYEANKNILCYLYETSYNENVDDTSIGYEWGMPTMSTITPMEMGVNSIVLSSFNASADDLNLPKEGGQALYTPIEDHYINIVTTQAYKNSIYIDNNTNKITGFQDVPGNNQYCYILYKIQNYQIPHTIGCTDKKGTFTVRLYGHSEDNSYAYSAGSRVSRAVDMLINDQYIKYLKICANQKLKFTSLINYQYDNIAWEIDGNVISDDSIVNNYQFEEPGIYNVNLHVYSHSPLCNHQLEDIVKAQIDVVTLSYKDSRKNVCYGDEFQVLRKGDTITLKADTTTQYWDGKPFKMELNVPWTFLDTIIQQPETDECDIVQRQEVTIRPTFDTTIVQKVCDEYIWTHQTPKKLDTIHIFSIAKGDKLPIVQEKTHTFKTIYGCDSIVTMRVHLNKSYYFEADTATCQTIGGSFNWNGHTDGRTIHAYNAKGEYQQVNNISLEQSGTYVYIDSLHTQAEPYCDSVHVLKLTVHPRYEVIDSDTICQNASYTWSVNNMRYIGSAFDSPLANDILLSKTDSIYTFVQNNVSVHGCDSIHILNLYVTPIYDTVISHDMCDNESFVFNDTIFMGEHVDSVRGLKANESAPYIYTFSMKTIQGCDSIVRLNLYVHPTSSSEESVVICQSESGVYEWKKEGVVPPYWCPELGMQVNEIKLDQLGTFTYIDSVETAYGCDDIYILHLTVGGYAIHDTLRMCDNDTLLWHNQLYVGANFDAPYDAGTNQVHQLVHSSQPQIVEDSIIKTSIQGCDSVHYLTLSVYPSYPEAANIEKIYLCNDESYTFYDTVYNKNGEWVSEKFETSEHILTYNDLSIYGCDSTVKHIVYVHPPYHHEKRDTICQNSGFYQWQIPKFTEYGDSTIILVSGLIADAFGNQLPANAIPMDQIGEFAYKQELKTKHGCDSIAILHLLVNEISETRDTMHMCDNSFVVWNNHLFVGEKYHSSFDTSYDKEVYNLSASTPVIADTVFTTNSYGCQSFQYLTLYVHATYETTDTITICDNYENPFIWTVTDGDGQKYDISIPFSEPDWLENQDKKEILIVEDSSIMLHSKFGCDSLVNLYLTICPTYTYTTLDTICQELGGVYSWEGHTNDVYSVELNQYLHQITLDSVGTFTYVDSTKTELCEECHEVTCDVIHQLQLTVLPSYHILMDQVKISEEEIYHWDVNNITYGGRKTHLSHDITLYEDTSLVKHELQTTPIGSYVCDSVLLLELIIGKVYRDTLYDTICSNEPYTWYGTDDNGNRFPRMSIDTPTNTVYKDSYITNLGFDSIFYLNLIVHPAYVNIDSMTIHARTCQYSTYDWIRKGTNGRPTRLYSVDKKKWIQPNEISTDTPGIYTYIDSLQTQNGCDSVYTLILQIDSAYNFHDTLKICNDSYTVWENKIYVGSQCVDSLPNSAMPIIHVSPQLNFLDTIVYQTKTKCDSTRYLHLDIYPLYQHVDAQVTCDNHIPYIWQTSDIWGNYTDTITYVPSELYYIDGIPTKDIITITNRQRLLTSVHGCDSVVNLHLTVAPTYRFIESATICANDSYDWRGRSFRGHDTICIDSYVTELGCDSIYELRLYVNAAPYIFSDVHICTNQSEPVYHTDGRNIIWKPGDPMINDSIHYIYKTEYGCDSTFVYYLYFERGYDIIDSCTICSNDTIYMQSSRTYTLPAQFYEPGIELPRLDTLICDTLCSEYICKDELNKPTTCCCDSIFKMYIHVLPAYKHIDYDTICSNMAYEWRGRNIQHHIAGEYLHYDSLLTKHTQCDSIYVLNLYVKQSYNIEYYDTICNDEVYMFYGKQLLETGVYHDTAYTYNGCDSVTTLYLTVHDTMVLHIHDTICVTEKYDFFGTYLTERGYYDTITQNEWGCKQYNYLQLEVIDTTSYEIEIGDIICADDEEIIVFYSYNGRTLIEYSVLFDALGHSQGFQDLIHIPLDTNNLFFTIPIPKGNKLPHPTPTYFDSQQGVNTYTYDDKYNYPIPNKYHMTIIMHNGICGDTLQRKDTIVDFLYPSWIHEQHWNDGIVLYNETYNGGHVFSQYQWYQNGEPIIGATKEYLYIPSDLLMNSLGDCENYYQVELTRQSDGYKTKTCPICPVLQFDSIVPQKDYFSVVPTMVLSENPQVHILSTKAGQYRVMTMTGEIIIPCTKFEPNDNNYAGSFFIPNITHGWVNVQLVTVDGEGRTIKVLIQ